MVYINIWVYKKIFPATEDGWVETWSTTKGRLLSTFNAHRPIKKLINSYESHRMLLLLENCAQLPILCLHNTPAVGVETTRRRSARAQSVSSASNEPVASTSAGEIKKDPILSSNNGGNAQSAPRATAPKPTFDMLERSKSRTSLIEKVRGTKKFYKIFEENSYTFYEKKCIFLSDSSLKNLEEKLYQKYSLFPFPK